jgi:hypothetical protein
LGIRQPEGIIKEPAMLEGKCGKCGARFYGWALTSSCNQICESCGVNLEIKDETGSAFTGCSPFTAEEPKIILPQSLQYPENIQKK